MDKIYAINQSKENLKEMEIYEKNVENKIK